MNFLIFSAQYLPHMGGIENFTYNISKELLSRGNKVTVVTNNTVNSPSFEILDEIEVLRFNCYNFIDGRFPVYKKDSIYKEIFNHLDRRNYDLVIINARFYFHSILAAKYANKRNIPVIVIDHGTSHLTVHNIVLDYFGGLFEHWLTNRLKKQCDSFYGVSKASSSWLEHFGILSKGEIYNAIDIKRIQSIKETSNNEYRKRHKIPKDAIVISFTGRLIKEKGILQLIHVVQKINQEGNLVYCMIAGEGPLMENLSKLNDPHILILGRLSFEEVIHMLSESNIFCLPSDSEGFSTSILEAAACKNYIVTTARGGAREVLLDDTYGLVIDNNDEVSVYSALIEAINNSNRDLGIEKTYDNVNHNFTWINSVDRLIDIIDKMN